MEKIKKIEYYLQRGDVLGFVKETNNDEYMGWISIEKQKVNKRILELFTEKERPELVRKQKLIAEKPYLLEIYELKKQVYENNVDLPREEDYRISEIYRFESINDVSKFLINYAINIEDAKWITDIPSI